METKHKIILRQFDQGRCHHQKDYSVTGCPCAHIIKHPNANQSRTRAFEIKSLRGCNGALQWLTKESRPDLAVQANMSQQALSDPRVKNYKEANNIVRRAKQLHRMVVRIMSILLEDIGLVMHTDDAFQTAHGGASLASYLITVRTDQMAEGQMAKWRPLVWRSHNMKRVVSSTSAAATQSFLNGLGHAEWIAAHLAEMLCSSFAVGQRSEAPHRFRLLCVVDAKSHFDHLVSLSAPSSVDDERCGYDLTVVDWCASSNNSPHWPSPNLSNLACISSLVTCDSAHMTRLRATTRWASFRQTAGRRVYQRFGRCGEHVAIVSKKSEYLMSPQQTMLQRAAEERERRKLQRQFNSCQHAVIVLAIITSSDRQTTTE